MKCTFFIYSLLELLPFCLHNDTIVHKNSPIICSISLCAFHNFNTTCIFILFSGSCNHTHFIVSFIFYRYINFFKQRQIQYFFYLSPKKCVTGHYLPSSPWKRHIQTTIIVGNGKATGFWALTSRPCAYFSILVMLKYNEDART